METDKKLKDTDKKLKDTDKKYKNSQIEIKNIKEHTSSSHAFLKNKIKKLNIDIGELKNQIKSIRLRDISKIIIDKYISK